MKHIALTTVLTLATASLIAAPPPMDPTKLPPASTQQGLSFEKDIHPIFDQSCVHCHGEKEAKHGLRLDTLDGVMKGAKDHKVVVPGHSDQSRLVYAVATMDGKFYMPPKPHAPRPHPNENGATNAPAPTPPPMMHPAKPLTAEQVGLIRAWIDQGAKP